MIQWNAGFEVGYGLIDSQHRRLVEILNVVMDGLKKPTGDTATQTALKGLVDYTRTHFSAEDKLMVEHNYPDIAVHRKQHSDLIAKVDALLEDVKAGKQLVGPKTVMFLQNWLVDHILKTDKKLATFLVAKSQGGIAA